MITPDPRLNKILSQVEKEGDRKEFKYKGFDCLIQRNFNFGNLCGYVAIPIDSPLAQIKEDEYGEKIEVHGGITWFNHIPHEDSNKLFLGFDCAHAWDLCPNMVKHEIETGMPKRLIDSTLDSSVYRDMKYVEEQIKKMVDQVIKLF